MIAYVPSHTVSDETSTPTSARPASRKRAPRRGHREICNPNGASGIELGNITALGEREAVALRAAIDDAIHCVAARFSLTYSVERGRTDGAGCDYRVRLVAKAGRRAMTATR